MVEQIIRQINTNEWDNRASCAGLHAVFSSRWSEEETDIVNKKQQDLIFSLLPDLTGKIVLDIGCGIGRLTNALSQKAKLVIGLDISFNMLERAKSEVNNKNAHFIQASAGYLPFANNLFDIVLGSYVLQHILDDNLFRLTVKEIERVTNNGGVLLLVDGISQHYNHPINSNITVLRTWEQYTEFLNPCFNLVSKEFLTCVNDDYVITMWIKT